MESIYKRIQAAVQPDGTLPEGFSIQPAPEDPKALRFADGARDGIFFYHTTGKGDEALLEKLVELTRSVAGGADMEEAEARLTACFGEEDGMLGCVDGLHMWIREHQEELDPGPLFRFAVGVLRNSGSLGAVKYALSVLELLAVTEGEWRDVVRTLALSDELTLYCVFVACHWSSRSEELYAMARRTRGWGRVHAVREMQADTQEMRDWLLDEGWNNQVLPAYTALACARKGGLRRRLEGTDVSRAQLDAADRLIQALLDEGPRRNISLLEDGEELLLAWLDQLEGRPRSEEDQKTLRYLREECADRDWPRLRARLGGMEGQRGGA